MSNQLIEAQRYEIYLGLKRKWSQTRIANEIGVSKSTVSREIRRNSKPCGEYVWKYAQDRCNSRKHGFKGNHRKGLSNKLLVGLLFLYSSDLLWCY